MGQGWNLVGPTAEVAAADVYASENVWVIWRWDSATQRYELVEPTEQLLPGVAYWIYANAATEIP